MTIKEAYTRCRNAFLYKKMSHFPYSKVRVWALRRLGYDIRGGVQIPDSLTITGNFVYNRGHIIIGDRVAIGPNVTLVTIAHPNNSRLRDIMTPNNTSNTITICNDAWIGAGAIILPGITIGECAVVGAGSVVTHDVAPYTIVAGSPAREIRKIELPQ